MKKIPCEVYSRIVGYYRPITNWNPGKQKEFKDRRLFTTEMAKMESPKKLEDSPLPIIPIMWPKAIANVVNE